MFRSRNPYPVFGCTSHRRASGPFGNPGPPRRQSVPEKEGPGDTRWLHVARSGATSLRRCAFGLSEICGLDCREPVGPDAWPRPAPSSRAVREGGRKNQERRGSPPGRTCPRGRRSSWSPWGSSARRPEGRARRPPAPFAKWAARRRLRQAGTTSAGGRRSSGCPVQGVAVFAGVGKGQVLWAGVLIRWGAGSGATVTSQTNEQSSFTKRLRVVYGKRWLFLVIFQTPGDCRFSAASISLKAPISSFYG